MRRAMLIILPFLAAIVVMIGGFYLWTGARLMLAGNWPAGAAFAGFGAGGFILALALWSLRKMLIASPHDAGTPADAQGTTSETSSGR